MWQQRQLEKPMFSFWLNRKSGDKEQPGGELVLGGYDKEHYRGDIHWIDILPMEIDDTLTYGYWLFKFEEIKIGNLIIPSGNAIADTGTSLCAMPLEYADKLNTLIGAERIPGPWSQGQYRVDCKLIPSMPNFEISIEGKGKDGRHFVRTFTLTPEQYIFRVKQDSCMSGFMGFNAPNNIWILGDVFLGPYYSIFDFGRKKRIGFAEAI
jgi:hypothetical protein